jgi:small subunit ribosomal protein S17
MSKKILEGKIVSAKMQKTVVVAVESPKRHPIYGKNLRNTVRYKAHNELSAQLGQSVLIEECKPFGGKVTWKVIEVK